MEETRAMSQDESLFLPPLKGNKDQPKVQVGHHHLQSLSLSGVSLQLFFLDRQTPLPHHPNQHLCKLCVNHLNEDHILFTTIWIPLVDPLKPVHLLLVTHHIVVVNNNGSLSLLGVKVAASVGKFL